ncbi:MAG: GGDEF domain-containing protein, partial [Eggerthellaceae bacterium]|nr:GGDEF domain-containing protein [Eggerthellaceae bacterium]
NYTCEADENGGATVIHGYAQDANDQMGSAKWWRRQAEIDKLTGLLNRNAVEQDINLSMRTQGVGMMFMIDLDSFKSVNDELGHLAGDSLLRDVSRALADHFREGDVLGRYGGDEFVAFVPVAVGDPETIAAKRSEDIIESIHNIEITDDTRAGCSVGVAISHNREATFYDLLEVADQAMYQSKLKGKGTYTILDME